MSLYCEQNSGNNGNGNSVNICKELLSIVKKVEGNSNEISISSNMLEELYSEVLSMSKKIEGHEIVLKFLQEKIDMINKTTDTTHETVVDFIKESPKAAWKVIIWAIGAQITIAAILGSVLMGFSH
jgi:uncharacterized coiled-coil DUF342 family protein